MPGGLLAGLLALVVMVAGVLYVAERASGDEDRCARIARLSEQRAGADVGSGRRITVIGDSYAFGSGLERPTESWPSRLPGRIHVDAFPGSGFSANASTCPRVSYADRARAAARGAELVVVQGGLNDISRRGPKVRVGFNRMMRALSGHRVVVVGPANAPARRAGVSRMDALLAELSAASGARYLRMSRLDLDYLPDDLHLTLEGHRDFGDDVASRLPRKRPR